MWVLPQRVPQDIHVDEKMYGMPPADPGERQKMVLSLLRLGYTGSEIKDAIADF